MVNREELASCFEMIILFFFSRKKRVKFNLRRLEDFSLNSSLS